MTRKFFLLEGLDFEPNGRGWLSGEKSQKAKVMLQPIENHFIYNSSPSFCQEKDPFTLNDSLAQKITWTTLTACPRTTLSRVTSPASGLKSYIA